jgi:hypothetical protein
VVTGVLFVFPEGAHSLVAGQLTAFRLGGSNAVSIRYKELTLIGRLVLLTNKTVYLETKVDGMGLCVLQIPASEAVVGMWNDESSAKHGLLEPYALAIAPLTRLEIANIDRKILQDTDRACGPLSDKALEVRNKQPKSKTFLDGYDVSRILTITLLLATLVGALLLFWDSRSRAKKEKERKRRAEVNQLEELTKLAASIKSKIQSARSTCSNPLGAQQYFTHVFREEDFDLLDNSLNELPLNAIGNQEVFNLRLHLHYQLMEAKTLLVSSNIQLQQAHRISIDQDLRPVEEKVNGLVKQIAKIAESTRMS